MSAKAKMYHSNGLEYIVGSSYSSSSYSGVSYFSKTVDDNYAFARGTSIIMERQYNGNSIKRTQYKNQYNQLTYTKHSFTPDIFLSPSRPKTRFVNDNNEARSIAKEIFELMMDKELPDGISISILPFEEFKALHSNFGPWSSGILGFSINGDKKQVFIKENHLDDLILVIGHEIGHVLTESLPNKHDEEAKAFTFSIEWAKTIKKHNTANLGLSIKDEIDFQPARNGLHDIAFAFVDFLVKKGRNAMQLHDDLARGYVSVFNAVYPK